MTARQADWRSCDSGAEEENPRLTFLPCHSASTEPMTHIDDEYSQAGVEDPRVLITTSRDPSSKLSQFAKVRTPSSLLPYPSFH